jgi:hypothetical protein
MTAALLSIAAVIPLADGCDYSKKPKDSFVERVRLVCGDDIARKYANVRWRDRDYAQDSLLAMCIAYGD